MFKSLSKSTSLMFIFDLIVLTMSTKFWYNKFNLPNEIELCVVALCVGVGLLTLFLKANYKIREFNITAKNTYLLFEGIIFTHFPVAIMLAFMAPVGTVTKFLATNIITVFLILRLYRALFHFYLFNLKRTKNILVIGTNKSAKIITDEINNKKALKMKVIGYIDDSQNEEQFALPAQAKVFKYPCDIKQIITENNIDIVIVAIKHKMEERFLTEMLLGLPKEVKLYKMSEFYEMVTGKYYVDKMSINSLFFDFMENRSCTYDFCKRAYDIIAATIILLVTFPILVFIAIRVKLTDGGSPIYTQTRIGLGGKPFECLKLRTMYKNDYVPKQGRIEHTEEQDDDDRVIPFCKIVRKARLDEIPQMINIIKGEMSIVGPRTEWEDLVKIYSKEVSYYPCRMWTQTGWTGWAQINQGHCVLSDDIAEKLQYDLFYLKHRSLLWEIGILVKAVFLALGGRHG